jgi:hypothetical protein
MFVDYFLVYQFIRRLATPFNEWEAFKLGIIDERGNVLRKRRDLKTSDEKRAFGVYDVMILNLKKLLEKAPGGQSRLASYAAALFLIREWKAFTPDSMLNESLSDSVIIESTQLFNTVITDYIQEQEFVNEKMHDLDTFFEQKFVEEVPTVNVGSGSIAGLGIGPDGEPGFTKKQMDDYKKKKKMLRRFSAFKEELEGSSEKKYVSPKMSRPKYHKKLIPTKPISAETQR